MHANRPRFCFATLLMAMTCIAGASQTATPSKAITDSEDLEISGGLLMQVPAVQRELGLTDAQRAKLDMLDRIYDTWRNAPAHAADTAGRTARLNKWGRDSYHLLTPLQQNRVRELVLQDKSLIYWLSHDGEIARKIGITPNQRQQFEQISHESALAARAYHASHRLKMVLPKDLTGEDRRQWNIAQSRFDSDDVEVSARGRLAQEILLSRASWTKEDIDHYRTSTAELLSKDLQVLTPEQRKRWWNLVGKLFVFPMESAEYYMIR